MLSLVFEQTDPPCGIMVKEGDVILGWILKVIDGKYIYEINKVKSIPYETIDDAKIAIIKHILDERKT